MHFQTTDHVLTSGGQLTRASFSMCLIFLANLTHFISKSIMTGQQQNPVTRKVPHIFHTYIQSSQPHSDRAPTTTGHLLLGIFVDISSAAPGRTVVDPAGASALARSAPRRTRVDVEHSQHLDAPAISLLTGILFFSGIVVRHLSLLPNCLRFFSS